MPWTMNGTPKPIWRNGQEVGTVRQFDNRLLQFLLKADRPDLYGDRGKVAAPGPTPEANLDAEIGTAAAPDTETKGKTHAK